MEQGASDLSWLDNYFGYGGYTPRDLVGRYTSLSDFLEVAPDQLPSLPFNSGSWRESLPAFSYEVAAENLRTEALSLACGLRNKSSTSTSRMPALCTESSNSLGAHGEHLSSGVRYIPLEVARVDLPPTAKAQRGSFSSCISTDEVEEEELPPTLQDSGGSTIGDVESATTDSSERSSAWQNNGVRDDRFTDDIHDGLLATKGLESGDVDTSIGSSSCENHVEASRDDNFAQCNVVSSVEASSDLGRDVYESEPASESIWQGRPRQDWWDYPHSVLDRQVRYLENITPFTRLLDMENVKQAHRPEAHSPWLEGRSDDIYEQMGIRDPTRSYVALWLGFGTYNTVLFTSEVVDKARLDSMLAKDALHRLKLLLHPVRVSLPFPAKSAKDADSVGAFFGRQGASIRRFRARCGAEVTSVQIDLFSKWLLKVAMTKVGLRENNCLEAVLVDWVPDSPAVLTAGRINATEGFVRNFYAP